MKIGKRDIERILVEGADGEFLAEITDKAIEKEPDICVRLIGWAVKIPTAELVEELMTRDGVELIKEGGSNMVLSVKK